MYNQATKETFFNNVMVKIARGQADNVAIQMFREALMDELVKVNMEEITTLPAKFQESTDESNRYILQLYDLEKVPKIAKATAYQYLRATRNLITIIHKPLVKIDSLDIEQYLRWYKNHNPNKKNTAVTINNERAFLSAVFNWVRRKNFISINPVEGVDPEVVIQKPVDFLTKEEMERLRGGCRTLRDRALIEFLRSTGVRVGECVITQKDNVNWNTGDIIVYAPKTKTYRTVFLDEVAKVHVGDYMLSRNDSSNAIFVWEKKPYSQLNDSGIRCVLKRIAENAGMDRRVYPHLFRHTFGTWLAQAGAEQGMVADLLGHKDTRVTRTHYISKSVSLMRNVHIQQMGMR